MTTPLGYIPLMQTVAEAPIFTRQTEKLFSEDDKRALIDFLAEHLLAGDEIPGTGGVRKVRFAASGLPRQVGANAAARGCSITIWTTQCRFTPC